MLIQIFRVFFRLLQLRTLRKEQKKILLVAEFNKKGGTRTYLISLLHFLHKQGYRVTLLNNGNVADEEISKLIKELNFNILPVDFDFWCIDFKNVPQGLTKRKLANYQLGELLFWCRIQKQHRFSGYVFSVGYPGQYLYAFLLSARITYILHTPALQKADTCKHYLLRFCLSKKKQIITVSQYAKQCIEENWLKNKKSRYLQFIYNCYTPKFPVINNFKKGPVKKVLTIGSVEAYKNPLLFVETAGEIIAMNKNEAIEFIWAGDGSMLQTCRDAAAGHPQIKFIGNVDNVEALYQEATIYYQPSLLESHGIAVVGAMFHRLPCVVSDQGGLKESVEDGVNGFVVPVNNISASFEKINTLLHDDSLCDKMGAEGYKSYSKKFTPELWEKEMNKKLF